MDHKEKSNQYRSSELAALEARFLRYVQVDSQSDEASESVPSTACQMDMLTLLESELHEIGADEVELTEYGCLFATLPSTTAVDAPTIAFFAHVDTAPAFNASGVKPVVHRKFDGTDITLPDDPTQVLSAEVYPYLQTKIGEDIITASGTTLLGADDKAGVAIIMVMAERLLQDSTIEHGPIRICFTTDEEIGTGVRRINIDDITADFGYTLDGSDVGEYSYETFSADKAVINIKGVSTHPSSAYSIMVNALTLAGKLIAFLPQQTRTPETTQGRDGFIHQYLMNGGAAEVTLQFILRDFELEGLKAHGELLRKACEGLAASEPRAEITCTISPQYRNMRYWLENDMTSVELMVAAIERVGLEPHANAVRGGTDGSQLTERGLPTPNLFTGMQNVHGPLEYISVQDMARAVEVCVEISKMAVEKRSSV